MEIEKKAHPSAGPWAFLAGTAVGALLGVLFAPASGAETRRKAAQWMKDRRTIGDKVEAALKAGAKAYRENAEKTHA